MQRKKIKKPGKDPDEATISESESSYGNLAQFLAGASAINIHPIFNPIEAILKMHDEKMALYERMLKVNEEMIARLERLIKG